MNAVLCFHQEAADEDTDVADEAKEGDGPHGNPQNPVLEEIFEGRDAVRLRHAGAHAGGISAVFELGELTRTQRNASITIGNIIKTTPTTA